MAQQFARDPVCGKSVDKLRAGAVAIRGGEIHYFCSAACKARFLGQKPQPSAPRSPEVPPRRRFVTRDPGRVVLRVRHRPAPRHAPAPAPVRRFGEIFADEFAAERVPEPRRQPGSWPIPEAVDPAPSERARGRRYRRRAVEQAGELMLDAELPPIEHSLLVGDLEAQAGQPAPRQEPAEPRAPIPAPEEESAPEDPSAVSAADMVQVTVVEPGVAEPEVIEAEVIEAEPPPAAARTEIKHLVLEVADMNCPSCALRVERAIQGMPGVIAASANLALGWAVVELDVAEARQAGEGEGIAAVIRRLRSVGYRASVRRESTERELTLMERWLFARFGLAAVVLAVLAAMGNNPSLLAMAALGLVVLLGAGLPLLADAISRARFLSVNCNTMTAVGAVGAYGVAVGEVLGESAVPGATVGLLFEASAALITFALLTQLLQRRIYRQLRDRAQRALRRTPELIPLVLEAQVTKGRRQVAMDRVGRYGLLAVALVALILLALGTQLRSGLEPTLLPVLAMIAAASPHAPGVAVTLASMAGLQRAAERKVLFRNVQTMEMLGEMSALVATKSVVAQGTPRVQEAVLFVAEEQTLFSLVAGCEAGSVQPAGRALYDYAVSRGGRPTEVQQVKILPGYGISARFQGRRVLIGSRALMEREQVALSTASKTEARLASGGQAMAYMSVDGRLAAVFALADRARPGIGAIVSAMRRLGVHTTLLTGDPPEAARAMALEAGMDDVLAEVPPHRRAHALTDNRDAEGVLAVGGHPARDGELMRVGDVSIAVSDYYPASAEVPPGVWLMRGTFSDLVPAIEVARHARSISRQNAVVSVTWTLVLVVAAASSLLGVHGPLIAGGGAALLSSVLAGSTGRLLRRQPPVP